MPYPTMPTPVACPRCGNRFVVQLRTIVDVGEEPALKEEFLRGRVNYARCPKCGAGGILSTPLVYHDPDKELLIAYAPQELQMAADQQEQVIGSLVNVVMDRTPQEKRKGYFLQPKTALTMESAMEMILEADGVSKEVLERQRAVYRLINQLLVNLDDEKTLDSLVEEHRQELDYEFFLTLSSMIDSAEEEGDDEPAPEGDGEGREDGTARLRTLRERLLERVTPRMPKVAAQGASYDDVIQVLREAEPGDALLTAVALNRARLDYGFFQALTAKIDAARAAGDTAEADALTDLRKRINEALDQQNALLREAEDRANLLIMDLLDAERLDEAVRAHKDELDDLFLTLVHRYETAARQRGDERRAERMANLREAALNVIEEDLPPDSRLINRLARAEYPDATSKVLEEHRGLLNDAFLKRYDETVAALESRHADLAAHLKEVRGQIVAKMMIQRA